MAPADQISEGNPQPMAISEHYNRLSVGNQRSIWPTDLAFLGVLIFLALFSEPHQKGPENWCRAKTVEKCRKCF